MHNPLGGQPTPCLCQRAPIVKKPLKIIKIHWESIKNQGFGLSAGSDPSGFLQIPSKFLHFPLKYSLGRPRALQNLQNPPRAGSISAGQTNLPDPRPNLPNPRKSLPSRKSDENRFSRFLKTIPQPNAFEVDLSAYIKKFDVSITFLIRMISLSAGFCTTPSAASPLRVSASESQSLKTIKNH